MNQTNPYQAPLVSSAPQKVTSAGPGHGIWSDGKFLVVSKMSTLPAICVLTNQESKKTVKRTFYWHHPAIYFSILAGILIYVILVLILRKTQKLAIPLSAPALQKRKKALTVCWLIGLSCVAAIVAAIFGLTVEAFGRGHEWIGGLTILFSFIGLLITVVVGSRYAAILTRKKINEHAGWYKGVSAEYLKRFPPVPPNPN